ncbi:MAG: hypothetical protein LBV23_04770 [Deltaproteobacteria bacterium]|jgi:hypothetical protein|nr:hypothetical protein [Deltaproteobacteria bacterium]
MRKNRLYGQPIKGKQGTKKRHKVHHRKKVNRKEKSEAKKLEIPFKLPDPNLPVEQIEIKPESLTCQYCGTDLKPSPKNDRRQEQI